VPNGRRHDLSTTDHRLGINIDQSDEIFFSPQIFPKSHRYPAFSLIFKYKSIISPRSRTIASPRLGFEPLA
jgi:hypothetical protein